MESPKLSPLDSDVADFKRALDANLRFVLRNLKQRNADLIKRYREVKARELSDAIATVSRHLSTS